MGMIRTKTYIKYARINLQEAEAALSASESEKCARKVIFCTDALIKAVAAALPMVRADLFKMPLKKFTTVLEDLTDDPQTAAGIARAIFEARRHASMDKIDRIRAEKAIGHAGIAFTGLHEIFT